MAKQLYKVKSFTEAKLAFERSKTGKISYNTWIIQEDDGSYAVLFHRTKIIRYYADGHIELNSGGYQTVTTKQRMNQFSPFKVAQTNFEWFVYLPIGTVTFDWDNPKPFFDGILLAGPVLDALPHDCPHGPASAGLCETCDT